MKHIDAMWDGKIKPGFEMLVNIFAAGIWGSDPRDRSASSLCARSSHGSATSPGDGVESLVDNDLLPFTSLLIEPAKVLFLNNAINHGVLTPLGLQQAAEQGKSVLFLLEANPGAGPRPAAGVHSLFGKGIAKAPPRAPRSSTSSAASTRSTSRTC